MALVLIHVVRVNQTLGKYKELHLIDYMYNYPIWQNNHKVACERFEKQLCLQNLNESLVKRQLSHKYYSFGKKKNQEIHCVHLLLEWKWNESSL